MPSQTRVYVTVDTEFSAGGIFQGAGQPVTDEAVYCRVGDIDNGVGFIADAMNQAGAAATFFIEALNRYYLGPEPMGKVARDLAAAGQDLQLHLHPFWQSLEGFEGGDPKALQPNDSCVDRDPGLLKRLMRYGVESFALWGVPRPVALRTGNLHVDRQVYRCQAEVGLPLASNIGRGVWEPRDPGLRRNAGRIWVEGVLEFPVLSFRSIWPLRNSLRPFQITALSWPEIRRLLHAAHQAGVEDVVILTHPFEFVKKSDFRYSRLTANRVNQQRLRKLAAYVRDDPRFAFATFSDIDRRAMRGDGPSDPQLKGNAVIAFQRAAQNWLNDRFWAY